VRIYLRSQSLLQSRATERSEFRAGGRLSARPKSRRRKAGCEASSSGCRRQHRRRHAEGVVEDSRARRNQGKEFPYGERAGLDAQGGGFEDGTAVSPENAGTDRLSSGAQDHKPSAVDMDLI